jgi:coproporphyrinogen III oxidase-like Fe-S oxidoreductase
MQLTSTTSSPAYANKEPADRYPVILAHLSEQVLTKYLQYENHRCLTLKPGAVRSIPGPMAGHSYTLYIHIPFCESLCTYCSFNRFIYHPQKAESYFIALREEMRRVSDLGYKFSSLYIGGGTPTINIEELVKTIDLAKALFPIDEVSCETNPNHLTPEIIARIENRVQRLSVGVQSFDDTLLKQMNRFDKFGSGEQIFEKIQMAAPHFSSLNIDMIFNFPSQMPENLQSDLQKIIASGAQQVTFYPLMSSPSVERVLNRVAGQARPGREWEYYNIINNELGVEFQPLSSWTFVRGAANTIDEYIASGEEYVGIGSGAFSFLNGALYVNTFSLRDYQESIMKFGYGVTAQRSYNSLLQLRYALMMALFSHNIDLATLRSVTQHQLVFERLFLYFVGAFRKGKLTRFGRYLSVVMMREFFSGVNNVRDIARKALYPDERRYAMPVKYIGLNDYCTVPLLEHENL